jgi:ATP-dependent helicase/nuclease subunit B
MEAVTGPVSALLLSLEAETRVRPYESKRLIGPDVNYGRELLVALALRTGGWIGWEATNLRRIAGEIAFVPLHQTGVHVGSDIEIRVLVSRAFDRAIASGSVSRDFAALGRSLGFRQALRDSILELRVAGITPDALAAATVPESPAREVAAVLRGYEMLLTESKATDSAGVFRIALDNFDAEARYCMDGQLLLAPNLVERGLPGELLERLIASGARLLTGDTAVDLRPPHGSALRRVNPVADESVPSRKSILAWTATSKIPADDDDRLDVNAASVDMFSAATPSEELREVFRRVAAEGLRWDNVEIVTNNVDTYGVALDVLCQRLGVGGSMLQGIPLARTRLGRALERWFAWLEGGLPADLLRQALEAGELGAGIDAEPTALARELRALRIGWGRERYDDAVERIGQQMIDPRFDRAEDETDEEYHLRAGSRRSVSTGLHALLVRLLLATPAVPGLGDHAVISSSVSRLAASTIAWLHLVKLHGPTELQTADRVRTRLHALAELDGESTTFGSALAAMRDALSDVRAWPLLTNESKPWSASGGMVHLTDINHAGTTGRTRVFVVGLDADSVSGSGRQDPLIPDHVRAAFTEGRLSTTGQRREERGFQLSAGLASLRGHVTLSYATSGALDGTETGPAAVLLQARRLLESNAGLTYAELRELLSPPAYAVPFRYPGNRTAGLLDARDVWFDAISDGAQLLDGVALVRECFPLLDTGMRAQELARSPVLTQFTGYVPRAAGALDPTDRPERPISPSALEKLAACPLAWFYRYGLGLRAPEDPQYDPDGWLDASQRGRLLHEAFEAFAKQFASRRIELHTREADEAMDSVIDETIARWRTAVPPPGESIFAEESEELRQATRSFLEMERQALTDGDSGRWRHFEFAFGLAAPNGHYALSDGTSLTLKGRVDRIDELADGSFRVIDYKTGKAGSFRKIMKLGKFNGGRQLQPALYAGVLADLLGGAVTRFEYRFPTERGHNATVAYTSVELAEARPIVTQLLDHLRAGTFIPTTSSDDCKYCEANPICRVRDSGYGNVTSRRAAWAKDNAESMDAYAGMLSRRTREVQS